MKKILAATQDPGESVPQDSDPIIDGRLATQGDNPFGTVSPPEGILKHGAGPEGLVSLLNTGLKLLVVIAGIYALLNLIIAGYQFMTAGGDPKQIGAAWARIWQSFVGLLLVVGSFLIAAIVGQLLFGDARVILNPQLFTP